VALVNEKEVCPEGKECSDDKSGLVFRVVLFKPCVMAAVMALEIKRYLVWSNQWFLASMCKASTR
jgi:hypothetical protein